MIRRRAGEFDQIRDDLCNPVLMACSIVQRLGHVRIPVDRRGKVYRLYGAIERIGNLVQQPLGHVAQGLVFLLLGQFVLGGLQCLQGAGKLPVSISEQKLQGQQVAQELGEKPRR